MLTLKIPDTELFDGERNEFYTVTGGVFRFKHTLKAISEWEADFKKPYFSDDNSDEDRKWYYVYMCLDEGLTHYHLTPEVMGEIDRYISDPRTATRIHTVKQNGPNQIVTSEYIYSLMVAASVPFETEEWNLNRLLTLLEVISVQRNPNNKMTTEEVYKQNISLNEQRKRQYNTRG